MGEKTVGLGWGRGGGGGGGGGREGSCWSEHCCGSEGIQIALLREQSLLGQWGNTGSAPEGSSHYSGSDEIQIALLLEQSQLRRGEIQKGSFGSRHRCGNGGNTEKAPAGAGTAAAVGKTVG